MRLLSHPSDAACPDYTDDHAASKAAIQMVSAGAHAHRLGLGQLTVDAKSNALTAIPKLLKLLDIQGATVTIEAMGCQKEIAQAMTEQGADYVLALKENHQPRYAEVKLLLTDAKATGFAGIAQACVETVDGDHGRQFWAARSLIIALMR